MCVNRESVLHYSLSPFIRNLNIAGSIPMNIAWKFHTESLIRFVLGSGYKTATNFESL